MGYCLYRHFDAANNLLYVGISLSAINRLSQHSECSQWFSAIKRVEIERFESREAAMKAERIAIHNENPAHNSMRPYLREGDIPADKKKEDSSKRLVYRLAHFKPTYTEDEISKLMMVSKPDVVRWIESGILGSIEIPKSSNNGRINPAKKKRIVTGWQFIEFLEAAQNKTINIGGSAS